MKIFRMQLWLQKVRESASLVYFATVASKQTRKHIQDVFLRFLKDGDVIRFRVFKFLRKNEKCETTHKQGLGYKQIAPTFHTG